jgi:hypothetical protein
VVRSRHRPSLDQAVFGVFRRRYRSALVKRLVSRAREALLKLRVSGTRASSRGGAAFCPDQALRRSRAGRESSGRPRALTERQTPLVMNSALVEPHEGDIPEQRHV